MATPRGFHRRDKRVDIAARVHIVAVLADSMATYLVDLDRQVFKSVTQDLAYVSEESGRLEVYVQRFPELGHKLQVSFTGGDEPLWSPDGATLFYTSRGRDNQCPGALTGTACVWAVSVEDQAELRLGRPRPRLEIGPSSNAIRGYGRPTYDVSPDGRFVVVRRGPTLPAAKDFVAVLNWPAKLKNRP